MKTSFDDLIAFLEIARERSFTKASAKLGVSPSALSHVMKALEERLGVRLLTRTTRSVTPTDAGERLINSLAPMFDRITVELEELSELRDKPAGTVRITADEGAVCSILVPALNRILPDYPDINVEINSDARLTDIVAERFDAGVRLGDILAKDMIAVRIGPDLDIGVVGSPEYFERYQKPTSPRELNSHRCINLRLPSYGGLYAWEFRRGEEEFRMRVIGQLVFNSIAHIVQAALRGLGLAYLPLEQIRTDLSDGNLVQVLKDWTPPFPGYHLYYPSRKHPTPAFSVLVDALRYRP